MTKETSKRIGDAPAAVMESAGDEFTALEMKLLDVRAQRNYRLSLCDWTVNGDNGLTTTQKNKCKTYRQTLRDFPDTKTDHNAEVIWPDEPQDFHNLDNGKYEKPE